MTAWKICYTDRAGRLVHIDTVFYEDTMGEDAVEEALLAEGFRRGLKLVRI